jgi:membrane protein YdbS with pleckstrin-like domain
VPDWLRRLVLRTFRVPADPDPPAGDLASLRVFRAARPYFRYRLLRWGIAQVSTLTGLAIGLVIGLSFLEEWLGSGLLGLLFTAAGILAWVGFLAQVPLSYGALRLDYELRWYMLSDRAIRIREGIVRVREQTMTFANIQQISVKQGPLQRLLGIADVEVRTAGGGASEAGKDMHRGFFRGVADGEDIRDTIRDRVREYRDAGLGGVPDPGGRDRARSSGLLDRPEASRVPAANQTMPGPDTVEAARALLAEMRALRRAGLDRRR